MRDLVQYWILNQAREPVPASMEQWARFFQTYEHRVVKQEHVDDYWISTVFLGIDHGWGFSDRPVLFETIAFDDHQETLDMARCCTWAEAEAMHAHMVEEYRAKVKGAKDEVQNLLQGKDTNA